MRPIADSWIPQVTEAKLNSLVGAHSDLTHPVGSDTRAVQRFQPLYPGVVKVGSLGGAA